MRGKVLLVSDDPEAGGIWAYALGQKELEVVLVGSAEEALHRLAEDVFDLVVIDVNTPQLDGIDLCRRLRAETVIPILLCTLRGDEAHVLEAYQAGVNECIVKPIDPSLFLAKVGAWLRRSSSVPAGALDNLRVSDFQLDFLR